MSCTRSASSRTLRIAAGRVVVGMMLVTTAGARQLPPPSAPPRLPNHQVVKLSPTTYRLGSLDVDTAKREVAARGHINDVGRLEFVANTKGGLKAYESAITIEADAVTFNAALLLIGLDPRRAVAPKVQFDRSEPQGDPVEIYVTAGDRRFPVEELLYDERTKKTLRVGPWVYTGSTFVDTSSGRKFLAELDGVLIGLMHGPQALIENPRNDAVGGFGNIVLNKELGLRSEALVTVTIKALDSSRK